MLAYGRSRRTLRFSHQDEKNFIDQINLTATTMDELFNLDDVSSSSPKSDSSRTLVTPVAKNTGSLREVEGNKARMSTVEEEHLPVRALEPSSTGQRKLDSECLSSQDSGKRPQFRLAMDLGPESESSDEENGFKGVHRSLLSGHHSSSADGTKRTDSRVVGIKHLNNNSQRIDRIPNENGKRIMQLSSSAIQTSLDRARRWYGEDHLGGRLSHHGDNRDSLQSQRAPPSSRIGGPRSQHLIGNGPGWSRAPFVTPDHANVSGTLLFSPHVHFLRLDTMFL